LARASKTVTRTRAIVTDLQDFDPDVPRAIVTDLQVPRAIVHQPGVGEDLQDFDPDAPRAITGGSGSWFG
jgi:hypothetical protein